MRILGLDFTSSWSSSAKANHLVESVLDGHELHFHNVRRLESPSKLAMVLSEEGPWVLGLDFPFGLPEEFVDAQRWGREWASYAAQATALSYAGFRRVIESFRASREEGRKQPGRRVDKLARSQSPLTTVRTPVASMFHAGVRWLLDAPCDVLPFRSAGKTAVVVEAYPALITRQLVSGNRYKDGDRVQTREVRDTLLRRIKRGDLTVAYGFEVQLPHDLERYCLDDDHGDVLDSVLCAVQAAWTYTQRDHAWGIPQGFEREGWITDPSLVRSGPAESPPWTAILEGQRLPGPPKGAFNSSNTRVRPVFRALLRKDRTGQTWVPTLLRLATRNAEAATQLASMAASLDPRALQVGDVQSPGQTTESLEGCFERLFVPPAALLEWCIDHPDSLTPPKNLSSDKVARVGRLLRRSLLGQDHAARQAAQDKARALLKDGGADGSRRAWWAFEGFTSVDCALETPELLLLIEGKRFEHVSDSGSWIPERNQISRNLEVAWEYARCAKKAFAVLLIGPDGSQPPSDATLRAGWPHLTPAAQDDLLQHFLGATTWRSVCHACGLDYESLPITTADAASQVTIV